MSGTPAVQRRVLAILMMVPIYSVTSWLSLVFDSQEVWLGALRDIYEAYAVYTFVALLIEILSDGRGLHVAVAVLAGRVRESWTESIDSPGKLAHKAYDLNSSHLINCCYDSRYSMSVSAANLDQCRGMAMQAI